MGILSHPVNESDGLQRLETALAEVQERIEAACGRAGRTPDRVLLIGVTKEVPGEVVGLAVRAGLRDLGENYVQDLVAKHSHAPQARWHFIGRLQANKVRGVLDTADIVHTLEPGSAADRLARIAEEQGRVVDCLVEVDFTGHRVGVAPNEAQAFVERMHSRAGVRVLGLMTVAPLGEDPRPSFSNLRDLRDRFRRNVESLEELSMGMSADLEAAVEEGATMVRVGTAIFGPREVEAPRR